MDMQYFTLLYTVLLVPWSTTEISSLFVRINWCMLFTYSKCIISLKTKLIIQYEIRYFKQISFDTGRVQVILDVVCRPLELIVPPKTRKISKSS
jgi:hypothetical protein